MFSLLLALIAIGLGLGALLLVGSLFFQGYIYTEPSAGLMWQAPAAAGVLWLFFTGWSLLIANSATASPSDVPYDTVFRFNPSVDMVKDDIKELTAVTKDGKKTAYALYVDPGIVRTKRYVQKETYFTSRRDWNPDKVTAIHLKHDGQDMVFELAETEPSANRQFVHKATGYTIIEYDNGPGGIPRSFRWSRFLVTLLLNFVHFVLWFVCLWLIVRFQWGHALGLAIVMWFAMTLIALPMLLDAAGQVALDARTPQAAKTAIYFAIPHCPKA